MGGGRRRPRGRLRLLLLRLRLLRWRAEWRLQEGGAGRRHLVRVELVLDESEHERALAHVAVAQLRSGRRGRRQRQWWWPCVGCTTLAPHGCGARTSTSLHSVTRPRGAPAAAGLRSATVRGWTALRRLTCLCHLSEWATTRGQARDGDEKSFLTDNYI